QRIGDRLERLVDHWCLRGDLTDEVVETVGGGDYVVFLVVEIPDIGVELADQAAQVLGAAGECGAERFGDVLDLAHSATVEYQGYRRQRLLGARVGSCRRQRDQRTVVQLALRWRVGRGGEFDVQGAEQAG